MERERATGAKRCRNIWMGPIPRISSSKLDRKYGTNRITARDIHPTPWPPERTNNTRSGPALPLSDIGKAAHSSNGSTPTQEEQNIVSLNRPSGAPRVYLFYDCSQAQHCSIHF